MEIDEVMIMYLSLLRTMVIRLVPLKPWAPENNELFIIHFEDASEAMATTS